MRRHRSRICRASGLGVGEVIRGSGRRHATVRWRGPSKTGHVGASIHTVRAVIAVGRGLQRLGRGVGMRGHRGSNVGRTSVAGKRRRCRSRRSSRAALGEITTHVRGDRTGTHVVVAGRSVHVQRRKFTTRRHGGVLRG